MHIKITLRKNHVYSCVITCNCGYLLPTEVYFVEGLDWYSISSRGDLWFDKIGWDRGLYISQMESLFKAIRFVVFFISI